MNARPLRQGTRTLPGDVRSRNLAAVLQHLFTNGPHSRADLARATGLTKVTMSALVEELLDRTLVTELGEDVRPDTPGKRPILIGLSNEKWRIAAVDLTREGHLSAALLTLTGEIVYRQEFDRLLPTGEEGVDDLAKFCTELIGQAHTPIIGLGISSPGVVDTGGTIVRAPKRGWRNLSLEQTLTERLGLPVTVANDANCAALGEHTFGGGSSGDILSVLVGNGIGAGLVVNGSLVVGTHSAAGEIAHITATRADEDAPWDAPKQCECGRFGCLETLLSEPELRAATSGLSPASADSHLRAVGDRLGRCLAPMVALLNLPTIILSGPHDLLEGTLVDATSQAIAENTWPSMNGSPTVRTSQLDERAPLIGAAALVLSDVLGIS